MVDVFDKCPRFIKAPRAKVDGQHHLGIRSLGPGRVFVNSDLI